MVKLNKPIELLELQIRNCKVTIAKLKYTVQSGDGMYTSNSLLIEDVENILIPAQLEDIKSFKRALDVLRPLNIKH